MASLDEPQSLRAVMEEAERGREALEGSPDATSPEYATLLSSALQSYSTVLQRTSALGLFSTNEGLEELSTASIPYMLADFRYAELVQRTPRLRPREKLAVLRRARASYEAFLALAEAYGLIHPPHVRLLERYREDEGGFAVAAGDAAARREAKVANYRAEKALRERLEYLRKETREGDEDVRRECYVAEVGFAVHATFQALDSMNREIPLLESAPETHADTPAGAENDGRGKENGEGKKEEYDTRLDIRDGGALLTAQGKVLRPFTLVKKRDEIARGVFRPGHNLPTMSIDEYLEEEVKRGGVLQGGVEPKKVVDEDDEEAVDRETYKAREWDEFKDNNRRGAGNTMNMG